MADLDLPRLRDFLAAELITGGRSNLTYRVRDDRSDWVLRRPPMGDLTPSAHDMEREYRMVAALAGSAVPVARAVVYCADPAVIGAPFAVVEHVAGQVIRTPAPRAPALVTTASPPS